MGAGEEIVVLLGTRGMGTSEMLLLDRLEMGGGLAKLGDGSMSTE